MERLIQNLKERSDDSEQYHRRLCLRIGGVELKQGTNGESGDESLKTVKKIFRELKVSIPEAFIDRAHRIGNIGNIKEEGGTRYRQIIVRFTIWRHNTEVYRARKNSDSAGSHNRAFQDYGGRQTIFLKEMGRASESCYVFSDVNCRICFLYSHKKLTMYVTSYTTLPTEILYNISYTTLLSEMTPQYYYNDTPRSKGQCLPRGH